MMLSVIPAALVALATLSLGAPAGHVLHEKREEPLTHWHKARRAESNAILPMRIGLAQRNLDWGYKYLMDVSDPNSPKYGEHWTQEEVHDHFAPAEDSVAAVKAWLGESGIMNYRVTHSDNKQWLAFDATTEEAERLLHTEYHEHRSSEGHIKVGCDEYHLPYQISPHVDYIYPGVHLSPTLRKSSLDKRELSPRAIRPVPHEVPPPSTAPFVMTPAQAALPPGLRDCGRDITPTCIQALYNIPVQDASTKPVEGNAMGVYENGDTYAQSDLNKFFAKYSPNVPQGTHPLLQSVDGGEAPVPADSVDNTGESDIDIDMAYSLIYPQSVTVYQVDDRHRSNQEDEIVRPYLSGTFNTFLDAIDGSYCNYTAYGITGDSPGIDASYPDPAPGGYKGKLECGVYKPTNVISISYGASERDLPTKYQLRQCNEFMKLGLQGVTILVATGDYGVASFPGDDGRNGCLGAQGEIFNPGNPNSCPYCVAVGATRLYADQTVHDAESGLQANLSGRAQNFSSTGGFSNIFSMPDYQASTVKQYFKTYGYTYPTYSRPSQEIGANGGIYNKNGRAQPDVSANGAEYSAYTNGTDYNYYGTSLAAPLWGSIITLINEARLKAGKKVVGFPLPALYQNPGAMNDIVNGSNPGCRSNGFKAVPGWDPVTGLGTPNFPKLLSLFMGMK